jgi:hypothetical protein
MRVIIEFDNQTGAVTTSPTSGDVTVTAPASAAASGGSPSAVMLGQFGMPSETPSAGTYDAGPPSADLVTAIAAAAPSSLNTPGSEAINGGPSAIK